MSQRRPRLRPRHEHTRFFRVRARVSKIKGKTAYEKLEALNPLSYVNDLFSDSISVLKWAFHRKTHYPSTRILVCTSNLVSNLHIDSHFLHILNPMFHIFLLIDGEYETRDPNTAAALESAGKRAGIISSPVWIPKGVSEDEVVHKIIALDKKLRSESAYHFLFNNCGAYTKRLLRENGLIYPVLLNFGIGSEIAHTKAGRQPKSGSD